MSRPTFVASVAWHGGYKDYMKIGGGELGC